MDVQKLFTESPQFETDRLLLRRLTPADAGDYYEFASDPIVTAQTTWARHITVYDSIEYLEKIMQRYEQAEEYHWGIVYKSTGRLIGRTGLIRMDQTHSKAELGYVISNKYWNQGIITEATHPILSYGFQELGINRIEARCNYNNLGSYRVMEKLGMELEGILRKQLKIKGEFLDQRMYSILKDDYCVTNGSMQQ